MDEEGDRRFRAQSSGDEVDRLSNLPESLISQILLNLPTKDVVKTSVLSHRWRNLWRCVPALDLECGDFPDCNAFVTFVDSFLGFTSKSFLQFFKLKLKYEWKWDKADIARWIDTVLKRKVQHLHVLESMWEKDEEVEIPLTVYTCESLVSLELSDVILPNPKSVSLLSVKVIYLDMVKFANDCAFEMLISSCPILESLTVNRIAHDNVKVFRMCSQSLLSFEHFGRYKNLDEDQVILIDAPRLETLVLFDRKTDRFIISNLVSLVTVFIDVRFNFSLERRFDPNDLPKRNMIRDFLIGISRVNDMVIYPDTLEVIYNLSRCEQLPLFRNLSVLNVKFVDYRWEMLPIFLESCPNLKLLALRFSKSPGKEEGISILPGSRRFLTSLEYVKIVEPMVDEATEMKLVSYFLENSTILKKFTFCLGDFRKNEQSDILKKLLAIPRLSTSCQVVVL